MTSTVFLAKNAVKRKHEQSLPPDLEDKIALLPRALGQAQLGDEQVSLDLKKLEHPDGLYRLRDGDWRVVFKWATDVLVVAIGPRGEIYQRVDRMRVIRSNSGVRVVEIPEPVEAPEEPSTRTRDGATTRSASRPKAENPLTPFTDAELLQTGAPPGLLTQLRRMPAEAQIEGELEKLAQDVNTAALMIDLWQRPAFYLEKLRETNRLPTIDDLAFSDEEFAERLADPMSERDAIGLATAGQIRKLLRSPIEDWMVFLHPEQREFARREFNGPARLRGGAGSGKTVVALHRARNLARGFVGTLNDPGPGSVLLTTFVRTLPDAWSGLLEALDAKSLEALDIRNFDRLAMEIARSSSQGDIRVIDQERRDALAGRLMERHGLDRRLDGATSVLIDEFDHVITGRGIASQDAYREAARRGRGVPLPREDRDRVWAAYEGYRGELRRRNEVDWPTVRLDALGAVANGEGPRYDAVIVDEAQDVTEVGIRFLMALDRSPSHCNFMLVGDGRQAIYPCGFSLASLGIDVRGRARVLNSNWRNSWWIWAAARALLEASDFEDLDDESDDATESSTPLIQGDPAELHLVSDEEDELDLLVDLVRERIDSGTDPGDVAVLTDTNTRASAANSILRKAGLAAQKLETYDGRHAAGVLTGTFFRAKGLEFKEVFVSRVGEHHWPSRGLVPPGLPKEEHAMRYRLQLRALHVAMTRARDHLALLSTGDPAPPVRKAEPLLERIDYR